MTDLTPDRLADWEGDPNDWPHTPPLDVWAKLTDRDSNFVWRVDSGHLINLLEAAIAALEAKTAEAERLTPKQSDGWSTQDRQEAKQEAERRWTDDWDGCQSDFDRGGINGFILGAEWQKARETFVSYKTIADRAEAALERVRALHPRKEFDDSPGEFYCDACQRTAGLWPCPTVQVLTKKED